MDAYQKHFGFREPPFSVTPDPRFLYANPAYREAYATLRYGIEGRKGFIVVTGEAGTGKTTLLRMLMQDAGPDIETAFLFNPPHDSRELLTLILNELQVAIEDGERISLLTQFNDYLLEQLRKRRIVALLIDEAQGLSHSTLEELRLLSNLETSKEKLIQIVLIGQPELERTLDRPDLRQLKQRVALRCSIEPLATDEVAAYVEWRLRAAGYAGEPLFDAPSMEKIALYSRGIPRSINVIAENSLLRAWKSSSRQVTAEMVEQVVKELRLPPPSVPATGEAAGFAPESDSRPETPKAPPPPRRDDLRGAVSMYDFAFVEQEISPQRHTNAGGRAAVALSVGVWLTAFAVAVTGLFLYNGYNGGALWAPRSFPDSDAPPRFLEPSRLSNTPDMPFERPVPPPVKVSPVQAPVPLHPESVAVERPRGDPVAASNLQRRAAENSGAGRRASTSPAGLPVADAEEGRREPLKLARKAPAARTYTVVGASFVRETPRSDAEITTTLPPGARVQVLGKAGEYFRVRGLDGETATGYVHQEDAFFEPSK